MRKVITATVLGIFLLTNLVAGNINIVSQTAKNYHSSANLQKMAGPWAKGEFLDFEYAGLFADPTYLNGGHGIAVDKYDRVWIGNFRAGSKGGLVVLNADGTAASISPIASISFPDTTINLAITDGCRGMASDHEGNILYCNNSSLIRINAETGAGMNYWVGEKSLAKPGVDENGNIYVGTVAGVSPVIMLDPDFNEIMSINLEPHAAFARGIAVSPDGKDIISANLNEGGPVYIYHSDIPGVIDYAITDSIKVDANGDEIFPYQCVTVDFGPGNTFWISHDDSYAATGQVENGIVVFDLTAQVYEYLYIPMEAAEYNGPRGVAFSSDGNIAYVISFNADKVYKFVRGGVGVVSGSSADKPSNYQLSQNYPNPFNPTTTIQFSIPKHDFVELKVYNNMGSEVVTLINEPKAGGRHEVIFDASNLASGVYYYKFTVNRVVITKSMLLVK